MKNVHVISTDKPSRLSILNSGKLDFGAEIMSSSNSKPQHIYITSNEEIKEGDWYYYFGHIINYECDEHTLTPNCKKIILTTDQDLIKDGVQSIDDEFLQWFVKNPSCEEVEVNSIETNPDYKSNWENRFTYEIIIPKEEPKQLTNLEIAIKLEEIEREEVREVKRTDLYNSILSIVKQIPRENVESDAMDAPSCAYEIEQLFYKWQEPKQETTLEEAAENYSLELLEAKTIQPHEKTWIKSMFVHIARLQRERMYSIIDRYVDDVMGGCNIRFPEWFEQFKKK